MAGHCVTLHRYTQTLTIPRPAESVGNCRHANTQPSNHKTLSSRNNWQCSYKGPNHGREERTHPNRIQVTNCNELYLPGSQFRRNECGLLISIVPLGDHVDATAFAPTPGLVSNSDGEGSTVGSPRTAPRSIRCWRIVKTLLEPRSWRLITRGQAVSLHR